MPAKSWRKAALINVIDRPVNGRCDEWASKKESVRGGAGERAVIPNNVGAVCE